MVVQLFGVVYYNLQSPSQLSRQNIILVGVDMITHVIMELKAKKHQSTILFGKNRVVKF